MDVLIQSPWFRRSIFPAVFPRQICDQHFWNQWDSEFVSPFHSRFYYQHYFWNNMKWWDTDISEARMDEDHFLMTLDVKHFSPNELSVKVTDEYLTIHGKHKERQDEHGHVAREFFRKYKVPTGVERRVFTSCLSIDGVLSVCAARNKQDLTEHHIPITCEKVSPPK